MMETQLTSTGETIDQAFIKKHSEEWIYMGKVLRSTGLLVHAFETADGETNLFKRSGIPSYAEPGSVWKVTVDDEGSYYFKGDNKPQYLRMIEDAERCAQLQAVSRAAEIQPRMERQAKKDMSVSEIEKLLEPLRWEYAKRNRAGKAALFATIYERIGLI